MASIESHRVLCQGNTTFLPKTAHGPDAPAHHAIRLGEAKQVDDVRPADGGVLGGVVCPVRHAAGPDRPFSRPFTADGGVFGGGVSLGAVGKVLVRVVDDEPARVRGAEATLRDGTLVGAVSLIDVGVANLIGAGIPLASAVTAGTKTPADLLRTPELGRIAVGAAARLSAIDPGSGKLLGRLSF